MSKVQSPAQMTTSVKKEAETLKPNLTRLATLNMNIEKRKKPQVEKNHDPVPLTERLHVKQTQ